MIRQRAAPKPLEMAEQPVLNRSLNLGLLTLYGLGTTIGAGIYVLIGTVAGQAGMQAPFSFLVAALVASFTAYSFSQLSIRYPRSAGEAVYVKEAFSAQWLSTIVGLIVALSSIIAAAAILSGATGYVRLFIELPPAWIAVGLTLGLGLLAAWGIKQSAMVAGLLTIIEILGLFVVIWFGIQGTPNLLERLPEIQPTLSLSGWNGLLVGSMLAFFAFIGFEDLINMAEEVVDVQKTLPRAIYLSLIISSILYFVVVAVGVLAVPPTQLAASETPIALIVARGATVSPKLIGAITVIATVNGALIQMILAARVFYGLGHIGGVPAILGRVNRVTKTPLWSTLLVVLSVLISGALFPLEELARVTSLLTLAIFTLVNLALFWIEWRTVSAKSRWRLSILIPLCGTVVSGGFMIVDLLRLVGS